LFCSGTARAGKGMLDRVAAVVIDEVITQAEWMRFYGGLR
jgi:hypothetical protein